MSNGLLYSADYNWMTHEVRLLDKSGNALLRFFPDVGTDDITKPLTFISKQDSSHITLKAYGFVTNEYEYMLSAGSGEWEQYTLGTKLTLSQGNAVSFRISAKNMGQDRSNYVYFTVDGVIEAWNNVQSIVDVGDYTLTVPYYGLYRLFNNCRALIRAPKLPATTLASSCYKLMFQNCTSLMQAPQLPATSLASSCYEGMFQNCASLAQAPELPATTLAQSCYSDMFFGCTSLTQSPVLPATTLVTSCYEYMFSNCLNLGKVYIEATNISAPNCLNDWLEFVSSTGDFYCNPDTNFPTDSASGIPTGWVRRDIALTKALTLTATKNNSQVRLRKIGTLDNTFEVDTGNGWEDYTFGIIPLSDGASCKWRCKSHPTTQTSSNYVQFVMSGEFEASGNTNSMLSRDFENTTSLQDYAFYHLFYNCSALVKAPLLPSLTLSNYCYKEMYYGCTSLRQVPDLPATTLVLECYRGMFDRCSALVRAPRILATSIATDASNCCRAMFNFCTSLTDVPDLLSTNNSPYCYYRMFNNCSSLVKAPELPATTYGYTYCYYQMFYGCTSLKEVRCRITSTSAVSGNVTTGWLYGVPQTGDFYCYPNAYFQTGANGIPTGWTRHDIAEYPTT